MKKVVQILERWNDPHPISLNFDWREDFAEKCLKPLTKLVRLRAEARRRISSIGFADDKVYYPLQAADLLCYGTKLRLEGRVKPFFQVLTEGEPGLPPLHYESEYWDAAGIDKVCAEVRAKLPPSAPSPAIVGTLTL